MCCHYTTPQDSVKVPHYTSLPFLNWHQFFCYLAPISVAPGTRTLKAISRFTGFQDQLFVQPVELHSRGYGSRTRTNSRSLDFKSSAATITPSLHMREPRYETSRGLLSRSPCISFYWNLRATMFTPLTSGERSISLLWEISSSTIYC